MLKDGVASVMIRLNSSLRSVKPETTLARAREVATALGISRVTDITRLDKVGIPVFASVRPTAVQGSLCVNAGKGINPIEAQVGAYMEAIEYAMAEPDASRVEVALATPRDILDGNRRPEAILDFCPIVGQSFDLATPLACVVAEDVIEHRDTLVPAELVLLPYVGRSGTGKFGSHSNGLASGNTVAEATLHGLLEVIERDIRSFHAVRDASRVVPVEALPERARELVRQVLAAGLKLCVRYLANEFGIPLFEAVLWDPSERSPWCFNGGYGCHLIREIALIRGITEAVQSRLSWIHGGRDDLADRYERLASAASLDAAARFEAHVNQQDVVDYEDVPDHTLEARCVDDALGSTIQRLLRSGIRHVCRVVLTDPRRLLHVVRVIVPRLEYFDRSISNRIGPRLRDFIRS